LFTVKDQACDGVRRLGIHRLQDVLVQVRGDGRIGVAEALAQYLHVNAGLEARRGVVCRRP
jgi:hypothetical protein